MRQACQERFPATAGEQSRHARRCRDACRDRLQAVSFEVSGGENVPGIPGACATRNFTYLVRGPWSSRSEMMWAFAALLQGQDRIIFKCDTTR